LFSEDVEPFGREAVSGRLLFDFRFSDIALFISSVVISDFSFCSVPFAGRSSEFKKMLYRFVLIQFACNLLVLRSFILNMIFYACFLSLHSSNCVAMEPDS
jgi:hypothetical protein